MVKKMANDGYIPYEIQEEIMKRLPPQLLVWYRKLDKKECVSIADDDTFPRHKLYLTPLAVLDFKANVHIGTTSHGLLCYYIPRKNLVLLWNPTIRKTVSINLPDLPVSLDLLNCETTLSFGVCPSTYDPKLVKTIFNTRWKEIYTVQVFTLSLGVWRSPHSNLPRKSIYFSQSHQVYVDGCIYWSAFDYFPLPDGIFWPGFDIDSFPFRPSKMILSFSVASEEFTEICYPNSLALKDGIRLALSKLRESLVVLEIDYTDGVNGVWMMINHDNAKSFTKLCNINYMEESIRVVGFGNSGEAIVLKYGDANRALFVYEPNSKHVRSLIGILQYSSMSNYTETLLLLDH